MPVCTCDYRAVTATAKPWPSPGRGRRTRRNRSAGNDGDERTDRCGRPRTATRPTGKWAFRLRPSPIPSRVDRLVPSPPRLLVPIPRHRVRAAVPPSHSRGRAATPATGRPVHDDGTPSAPAPSVGPRRASAAAAAVGGDHRGRPPPVARAAPFVCHCRGRTTTGASDAPSPDARSPPSPAADAVWSAVVARAAVPCPAASISRTATCRPPTGPGPTDTVRWWSASFSTCSWNNNTNEQNIIAIPFDIPSSHRSAPHEFIAFNTLLRSGLLKISDHLVWLWVITTNHRIKGLGHYV